jgi:nodulation protein E
LNRVVATGWGVISPTGNDARTYWSSIRSGTSGFGPPTLARSERLTQKIVAEVKGFDPSAHFSDRDLIALDRVSQFAVVAAREAVSLAGISFENGRSERTAAIIGTGAGGLTTQDDTYKRLYEENVTRVHPLTVPRMMVNAPASQVSMHCGIRGPSFAVASACASATHAIGLAFQMIRQGWVDSAVAGGTEACLNFGSIKGWEGMRVMAPDACRPFSMDRKGLVLGEGAAVLVLESLDGASARGAEILGEIVGFGMSADAADLTNPDVGGMSRAMTGALDDAKVAPSDVQYVNAHGTGTTVNDATETQALRKVFGDGLRGLAVSSTKSMVGHALGAAGALEAVASLMAVREAVAPPTMNYLGPDPACDVDCVPNEARDMSIDVALSNSFAFGGLNAVLAFRRFS